MPVPSDAHRSVLPGSSTARGAEVPADLLLFGVFILLTALFGRDFAQLSIPSTPIYVTEVVLLVITALVLRRLGVRGAWELIRRRIPLIAFAIFVVSGAIAAVRGLTAYGFDNLLDDVGLAEYAAIVPIAVLVVSDRERLVLTVKTLAYAGAASVALWSTAYLGSVLFALDDIPRPRGGSAAGLYMTLPVLWIGARYAQGLALRRAEIAVAVVGLLAIGLTAQRGNWLALAAGVAVIAMLAPRRLRAAAVAAAAIALMAGGTVATELVVSNAGGSTPDQRDAGEAPTPGRVQAAQEVKGTVTGAGSAEGDNSTWRLDFWRYSVARMVDEPLGISLGRPLEFEWQGRYYDFRRPTPNPEYSLVVTGPHNSFVEIGVRMGVVALAALLALLVIGVARTLALVRDASLARADRVIATALLAMTAAAVVIASVNDALKGPYIGVFFWLLLTLLLVAPALLRGDSEATR